MSTLLSLRPRYALVLWAALLAVGPWTPSARASDPVIGHLKFLKCNRITTAMDIGFLDAFVPNSTRGADNLNVAYGVFVKYTDGTYRTWGDMLYAGNVDTDWVLGPQVDCPLFIYQPEPPSVPLEIDVTTRLKTVSYVRVAVVLWESDSPFAWYPGHVDRSGLGEEVDPGTPITRRLRGFDWEPHLETLDGPVRGRSGATVLCREVYDAVAKSADDLIGKTEFKYTREDLEGGARVRQIFSIAQLESYSAGSYDQSMDRMGTIVCSGHDSSYHGSLALMSCPPTVMDDVIARYLENNPGLVYDRFYRRIGVLLRNNKDEPVRFTLAPVGLPFVREADSATGELVTTMRRTVSDVLQPGKARYYVLDSTEDEILFHPALAPAPAEGFYVVGTAISTVRLRNAKMYLMSDDENWANVHQDIPDHIWDALRYALEARSSE